MIVKVCHGILLMTGSTAPNPGTPKTIILPTSDSISPVNEDPGVGIAVPTLESTIETGQDETENHGTPGLRKNAHPLDITLYTVGNSNKKKLISLMIIWSSKLVMESYSRQVLQHQILVIPKQ